MEDSFTIQLLETFKGFEFHTLWDVKDKFLQFERIASEAATGTGNLQGILQLTKSLENLDKLGQKVQQCFTRLKHNIDTLKWSFDDIKKPFVSTIYKCKCVHLYFAFKLI